MSRLIRRIAIAVIAITGLTAWDTLVIEGPTPWQSIYQIGEPQSIPEHSTISDMTLKYLDSSGRLVDLFGRQGFKTISAVDINASHFREELLYKIKVEGRFEEYGDDPLTEVEERLIPAPANFSGLPDYSYAIYDWLNKNKTCPAFSQDQYTSRCHEFFGWLGALNSVHFGSQAEKMYAHHHRNALALAEKVADLRSSMSKEERDVHEEILLEAEHLALAYEGYAQHFLQDRWAIGHMWERWGSPDTSQMNRYEQEYLAIGALSGLIHGAEAVVNKSKFFELFLSRADSMSSPLPGPILTLSEQSTAIPMEYVHVNVKGETGSISAIGDERLQDAVDGVFRLSEYDTLRGDQALNVDEQMDSLMRCAGAGWAETIRALGPGDDAGTYGAYKAPLSSNAPSFSILDQDSCWDMWATNKSMVIGLLGPEPGKTLAVLGVSSIVVDVEAAGTFSGNRTELITKATRMWLYGLTNSDGTEIAQGKMQTLSASLSDWVSGENTADLADMWGFENGGHYTIPDYVEPIGLKAENQPVTDISKMPPLPWEDPRGRDIQTLFGVFNQAHSDYWCENRDTLTEVRTTGSPKSLEICQRLADFAYQGTHPTYSGSMQRTRKDGKAEIRSVCAIHEKGVESDDTDDQENPYWLDQGYTSYDGTNNAEQYFTTINQVANWCARVPVLRLIPDPELNAENIVAEIRPDAETVRLVGRDLGKAEGKVSATAPDGTVIELDDIWEWTDTEITLGVSDIDWDENTKYRLEIELKPDPDRTMLETIGLFYIKVDEYIEIPIQRQVILDLGGAGPCGDGVPDIDFIDIAASIPKKENKRAIAKILKTYRKNMAEVKPYLETQLECMKSLRTERLPIIRDFIENYPPNINSIVQHIPSPRIYISHPKSVSDPTYYPNPSLISPVRPFGGLVDTKIWDGDIYKFHIDDLAGTIQLLESTELLLAGWDNALKDKDAFLTAGLRDLNLGIVLATAKDLDAVMEAAFVNLRDDKSARKSLKYRRGRARLEAQRWETLSVDLGASGQQIIDLFETLSISLSSWTQAQHTLTQIAFPKARDEIIALEAELKRELREAERAYFASCDRPCILYDGFINVDLDDDQFLALIDWINDLYSAMFSNRDGKGPFGNGGLLQIMNTDIPLPGGGGLQSIEVRIFLYMDENGIGRHFIDWPAEEANEIAKTLPEGLAGTRFK